MTGVSKILAAVLLAAGVVLAALAYYLARQPAPAPAAAQATAAPAPEQPAAPRATYPVVLAAKDIQAGTRLDAGMLKVQQWPIPLAHGYAKPEDLAGQVARLDIAGGEPITNQSLAQGLAQQLRDGERAVAVPVDEIVGAGNRITPGDLVDVFFALEKDNEVKGSQVRLLQSRVRVLAYGAQSIDGPPVASDKPVVQRGASPAPARSALLAVPVERVNELLLASRSGHLQLALRAPSDEALPDRDLFVPREAVISARAGLTAEQRAALADGVNRAYAGDSLAQLDGPAPQPMKRSPAAASGGGAGRTIEILRGDDAQRVRY
ncbi:Flp pilus assembly protein CpaB [Bordetella petrii]|uniref:Flp pilus assembly protein n=1 Tax=Bordetella petrii (strain ATCC BAA-461 / DSM 12804 / CCUG 43448 / CIP 107267 / Se-1111R) TaxID=340100 RepID=A9HX71_BORPD|nr:Flp pilus assembly protein CpaB [Bordetella petrii]CAP43722.1 putative Flp pilus assembly protein [Bordetella petrii]